MTSTLLAMTPFQPLGAQELAQRWGVSRQRLFQLLDESDDMPRGHLLARGRVWNLEEIEAYEQRHPARRREQDAQP